MKKYLTVHFHDEHIAEIVPSNELNLAQILFLNGAFKGVPLCSGMGRCTLCKVRYESNHPTPHKEELKKFSSNEIERGWRLSCLHSAKPATIFIPQPERVVPRVSDKFSKKLPENISLAVDLGTTGLQWAFTINGEIVKSGQELNPQIGLGSEVMSRLAFAAKPEQCKVLSELVTGRIETLIAETGKIKELVIAGNPSMTSILAQDDVQGLSYAPYSLPSKAGNSITISPRLPKAYIPAHFSPFVGADITAGIVSLNFSDEKPEYPYLFGDLGTNGEFVLALSEEEYIVSSVPMGPALEGVGLSNGRTAGPGAISSFTLTPVGLTPLFISQPDKENRPGITGTGYLSLCSLLLRSGVLTREGQFGSGNTPFAAKLAAKITQEQGSPALDLGHKLSLPAADVEEILKVKAAFNLAMSALLDQANLPPSSLKSLILGGAMGQHVNIKDLVTTGFIPAETAGITRAAGNTSLAGAVILTNNQNARDFALSLPPRSSVLELAGSKDFGQKYLERMIFQYVY
ncbi:ASKHA domain-containing protein [Maridesulfovibrio zosterae]|uniref:ASKHA domain-containing protein n=1 Tax=Maridesulfovibrio zosterae TaxID=82171 RepID=UPI000429248D|nr:ASKHA domain-containing protein [Maridesulfovibrio zosterae]